MLTGNERRYYLLLSTKNQANLLCCTTSLRSQVALAGSLETRNAAVQSTVVKSSAILSALLNPLTATGSVIPLPLCGRKPLHVGKCIVSTAKDRSPREEKHHRDPPTDWRANSTPDKAISHLLAQELATSENCLLRWFVVEVPVVVAKLLPD